MINRANKIGMIKPAGIIGLGKYLPPKVVTNDDLAKIMDTNDEWITTKTGIKSRRFIDKDKDIALSDICIPAARRAIKDAGLKHEQIDAVIVGAMSHDYPGGILTSNLVKDKIGAKNAFGLDLNTICPGAEYSMEVAGSLISSGKYKYVLVINGEVFSKYNHTRVTSVIFGDGAGAFVMGPARKGYGIIASYLRSQSKDSDKLAMLGGGSRHLFTPENVKKGYFQIQMDGPVIYKFAVSSFQDGVKGVLKKAGMKISDVDFLISHQANLNIIKDGMKQLGLPMDKTYTNIQKYGNIGGGSVIVALTEAREKGLIKKGDIVLCVAFGAGLAWGAVLMRWCY